VEVLKRKAVQFSISKKEQEVQAIKNKKEFPLLEILEIVCHEGSMYFGRGATPIGHTTMQTDSPMKYENVNLLPALKEFTTVYPFNSI